MQIRNLIRLSLTDRLKSIVCNQSSQEKIRGQRGKLVVLAGICEFHLRTVHTFVTAHTFCASRDTRVSYG